jgi:hypothetical protein
MAERTGQVTCSKLTSLPDFVPGLFSNAVISCHETSKHCNCARNVIFEIAQGYSDAQRAFGRRGTGKRAWTG